MSSRFTLIAAAAAALFVAPAFAASTASATLGPIQITLYDLIPTDDIAPSITFSVETYGLGDYVYTSAYDTYTAQYQSSGIYGVGAFDPISTSSAVPTAWATASISGPGTAQGSTLSASGTALGTTAPAFSYQSSQFQAGAVAPYYYYQSFTVSSGTAVVVTLPSVLNAAVSNTFDPYDTYGWESASASTNIYVYGPGASGTGYQSASDARSIGVSSQYVEDLNCYYGYCYGAASASDSASMGVSFFNVSGGDLSGQMYMQAYVSGYSYANVVPEPGTYAMLLAGLAAVGFVARRRRG